MTWAPRLITTMTDELRAGRSRDAVQGDVNAGRLLRPYRGVYVMPGTDEQHLQLRAACLHLGSEATVVIGSAALVHGLMGVPRSLLPQLAIPPGLEKRQRAGLELHFWDIPRGQTVERLGLRVTDVRRTLADTSRLLSRFAAVSLVDSALDQGLLSLADLPDVTDLMARRPNCVAGRRMLDEARVGAQSPLETRVRLRAADADLPPDELQVEIRGSDGRLLGYADMGYRLPDGGWLLVEADGRSIHEAPEALLHDRHRQNSMLAEPGVSMVRFTWADTRDPSTIPRVLRPILHRHRWRPRRRP